MNKEDVVHICNRVLLSNLKKKKKKEWNNTFSSNVDEPGHDHTKWKKSDRKGQISSDITYAWNKKNDVNELIYKTETTSQT